MRAPEDPLPHDETLPPDRPQPAAPAARDAAPLWHCATSVRPTLSLAGRCAASLAPIALGLGWLGLPAGHLIAAALVATLALDATWSRWNLRGLQLGGPAPSRARFGVALGLELAVRGRNNRDLRLHCDSAALRGPASLARSVAREAGQLELSARPLQRGRLHRVDIVARSTYPLGLVPWRARFALPVDLLVLPSTTRVPSAVTRQLSRVGGRRPQDPADPTLDSEFARWRPGQSLRRVRWKLSARLGQRVVSEPPRAREATLVVALSRCVPEAGSARREQALEQAFERAVSLAGSLVEHALRRSLELRLAWVDGSSVALSDVLRGRRGAGAALEQLAEVGLAPTTAPQPSPEPSTRGSRARLAALSHVVWIAVEGSPGPADLPHLASLDPELSLIVGPRQLETVARSPLRAPARGTARGTEVPT